MRQPEVVRPGIVTLGCHRGWLRPRLARSSCRRPREKGCLPPSSVSMYLRIDTCASCMRSRTDFAAAGESGISGACSRASRANGQAERRQKQKGDSQDCLSHWATNSSRSRRHEGAMLKSFQPCPTWGVAWLPQTRTRFCALGNCQHRCTCRPRLRTSFPAYLSR